MRLGPGDLLATGTPPRVGMGREPSRSVGPGGVVTPRIHGLGAKRWAVCAATPDD